MRIDSVDVGLINTNTYKPPVTREGQSEPDGAEEQYGQRVERGELEKALGQLNDTMEAYSTKIRFELHEESGEMMVKVINGQDGTVIREIPPEKVLNMVAYFKKILGIIVDKFI
ncbi:flagellar protein FlaG [Desulfoscipio sp. XC116]|uniref:flagellar protein FlaG n=1 Tax=Desulfoscipio sp. XC116 TaxID=3144975 RepID=UPI00325AD834